MELNITISDVFSDELKKTLRVNTVNADGEIKDLAQSAVHDMAMRGVKIKGEGDPLTRQAIKLYCKGNYGYDEDAEKFQKAYESLRDSMSLSEEYRMSEEEKTDG